MDSKQIREKFLNYFKEHDHAIIDSASVIPENNETVLFTTAGMQPLVPYLMGKEHPKGRKLADFQKCIRTVDIDEVGDNRHLTFFEMLGNWSLGSYFKEESIKMSYDFLVNHLNIPNEKLSVTCFKGDEDCKKDEVSAKIWEEVGIPKDRIYFFGKDDNWWIAGEDGPCGPDTEIFYDTGKEKCSVDCNPSCDCGKYVEIWNNVFMEYFKDEKGYTLLKQKNVDTGMGLERISMLLQGKSTVFELEMFTPALEFMKENSKKDIPESARIVAEHLRSSSIIIAAGILPKNTDRGYVLRRLLRRAIRHIYKMEFDENKITELINIVLKSSSHLYTELDTENEKIVNVILDELQKFSKTLKKGEKEFHKLLQKNNVQTGDKLDSKEVFKLFETYGMPIEITMELAKELNLEIDSKEVLKLYEQHQENSRQNSKNKFKGGLESHSHQAIKYHTATHLLHKALQEVVGKDAVQKGSNITDERLRFDFNCDHKLTEEEKQKIEDIVNEQIQKELDVESYETTVQEALQKGVIGLFKDKYKELEKITVYKIGDFSEEICGGPHVKNTRELGKFKIIKEEASSKGVRRIKAKLV